MSKSIKVLEALRCAAKTTADEQWMVRAEKAEAQLASLEASIADLSHPVCARLLWERDEAQAALAATKTQEPVGWWWIEDGIMHEPSRTRFTQNRAGVPWNGKPLYAAPVAAGESQEQREPDAVWTLVQDSTTSDASWLGLSEVEEYLCSSTMRAAATRLLAGRERVRLRVYVEEVES